MRLTPLLLLMTLLPGVATAQDGDLKRPDTWRIRPDRADADTTQLFFVGMPPGWHITTGPSVILWDPAQTATGSFRLESDMFFFRANSRDTEAYGVLFGGRDLDGPGQRYTYFVIRNDGRFLVKHRAGAETHTLLDWTAHDAVARHTGEGEDATVRNVLAVEAGPDTVTLHVNGHQVASLPRRGLDVDGLVGLRVNHALNLHVTKLEVTRR